MNFWDRLEFSSGDFVRYNKRNPNVPCGLWHIIYIVFGSGAEEGTIEIGTSADDTFDLDAETASRLFEKSNQPR